MHTRHTVVAAQPQLAAASVELVYLARYCPEQSGIEPVWNDVKQHQIGAQNVVLIRARIEVRGRRALAAPSSSNISSDTDWQAVV